MKYAVRTVIVMAIGLIALHLEQRFLDRVRLQARYAYYCRGFGYPAGNPIGGGG